MSLLQSNIEKLIEAKASESGFVKIGFAKAETLTDEPLYLKRWFENAYDADMKWIRNGFDKRKDVRLIMKDAKSVISLAYNYFTPFNHDDNLPKISRYAWGKDYHKILKKKIGELCRYIETLGNGFSTKAYVDDGPVMDKVWAVRSGVGWMGKHTNLINPEYGSWIFLCEIITNIGFRIYDSPIEDLCGSCRICIDACPTGAIVDEYVLDANLCISYQTIENRGEIPDYIDSNGWIFGCDVCQDVCPFNRNDKPTSDKNFHPKAEIFRRTKTDLEAITEEEFDQIFSDSPVKRTKYWGWGRNLERI